MAPVRLGLPRRVLGRTGGALAMGGMIALVCLALFAKTRLVALSFAPYGPGAREGSQGILMDDVCLS
jgi:hypothetical protein